MKKITSSGKYIFVKDYDTKNKYLPIRDYAKKGDIVKYEGMSLGFAHFRIIDLHSDRIRRIAMSHKEAFEYLEEVKQNGKPIS